MKEEYFDKRSGSDRRKNITQIKITDDVSQSFYEDKDGNIVDVDEKREIYLLKKGDLKKKERRHIKKARRLKNFTEKCRFFYWTGIIFWSLLIIIFSTSHLFQEQITELLNISDYNIFITIINYFIILLTSIMILFTFAEFIFDKYKKKRKFDRYNYFIVSVSAFFLLYILILQLYF